MEQGRPRLSISLLSSGRTDTVERCLASLAPLKEQVGAEIIAVDTDPEGRKEVRSVLEKYADRIIRFEWQDDFSAARNAGLSECAGEWFLYVDDDEWFIDAEPIVRFLKSAKSRRYGQVRFTIRNYKDAALSEYDDTGVIRLVRLTEGTHFAGKVHEYLTALDERVTKVSAVLGHTGYIYPDEASKKAHASRNIPLLEEMAAEEPDNPRWFYHLMLEYDSLGDHGMVREICDNALDILEKDTSEQGSSYRGIFIAERLRIERLEDNIGEESELYRRLRGGARTGPAADAYLDMEGARIAYILGNDGECRRLCRSYLKKYRKYHGRADALPDYPFFFLSAAFGPNIKGVVDELLQKTEKAEKAAEPEKAGQESGRKKGAKDSGDSMDGTGGRETEMPDTQYERLAYSGRPRLSISLLSSGRIESIEKCLSSLEPIRAKIATEVIAVDTDPNQREDVRTILERYADQIISYEWNDDFAAARNAGLDAARGEWFLFLDDDEWFLDAEPLIKFLKSKERKKYRWGQYIVRSYTDRERTEYTQDWVSRLVRMEKGVRFTGVVHEVLEPLIGDPKGIAAVAGHSGYIFENEEQRAAHSRRNISLLEKRLSENDRDVHAWMQLLQEYTHLDDWERQREICERGLALLEAEDNTRANTYRGIFAGARLRIEEKAGNWDEGFKLAERFGAEPRFTEVGRAYLLARAAAVHYNRKDFGRCRECAKGYLEIYDRLGGRQEELSYAMISILGDTFAPFMLINTVCMLLTVELPRNEWDAFDKYFGRLDWSGAAGYDIRSYEGQLLTLTADIPYDGRFVSMVEAFWSSETSRSVIRAALSGMTAEETGGRWNLVRAVAEADVEPAPWDIRALWAGHFDGDTLAERERWLADELTAFSERRIAECREIYKPELFDLYPGLLPEDCQEALKIRKVFRMPGDDYRGILEGLKQAIGIFPDLDDAVRAYSHLYAERIKKGSQPESGSDAIQSEMQRIIDALQDKVQELVSAGLIDEAQKVMEQIQKFQLQV